jgi:hypothetical protein
VAAELYRVGPGGGRPIADSGLHPRGRPGYTAPLLRSHSPY